MLSALVERIEGEAILDRVGAPLNAALHRLLPPGPLVDALSGKPLGHPAHPALVSAPIGCWTGALVADLAGEPRAGRLLTGLGVLSALPVAATGASDWADTTGAEQRVGVVHLGANLTATAFYAGSWWARRRGRQCLGVSLGMAGALLATAAGWLGGHLAYAVGVGVDTNAFDGGPTEWTSVDKKSGDPAEVMAGSAAGVSLAIVRSSGVSEGASPPAWSAGQPLQPPRRTPGRRRPDRQLPAVPLAWQRVRSCHRSSPAGTGNAAPARVRGSHAKRRSPGPPRRTTILTNQPGPPVSRSQTDASTRPEIETSTLSGACDIASGWPLPGRGQTKLRFELLCSVAQDDLVLGRLVEAHADAVAITTELGRPLVKAGQRWGVWAAGPADSLQARSTAKTGAWKEPKPGVREPACSPTPSSTPPPRLVSVCSR